MPKQHGQNFLFVLVALAFTLSAAACGVSGTSAASTPNGGANATATVISQAPAVASCPDATQSVQWPTSATAQVTPEHRNATIAVGQSVEVLLPFGFQWSVSPDSALSALQLQQPAGYTDTARKSCVWRYAGAIKGQDTLVYVRVPICLPGTHCDQNITTLSLTVTVLGKA